jgi:hypothetical protein
MPGVFDARKMMVAITSKDATKLSAAVALKGSVLTWDCGKEIDGAKSTITSSICRARTLAPFRFRNVLWLSENGFVKRANDGGLHGGGIRLLNIARSRGTQNPLALCGGSIRSAMSVREGRAGMSRRLSHFR